MVIDNTPDLPFLNIQNPFTMNESLSVHLDKHNHIALDTQDYFVKQVSPLTKEVLK